MASLVLLKAMASQLLHKPTQMECTGRCYLHLLSALSDEVLKT